MTLTQLLAAVRNRIGTLSSDAYQTDAVLTDLINAAMQDLEADRDWWWQQNGDTIATTAGDRSYAVNASWKRTESLVIADWPALEFVGHQAFEDAYPFTTSTGKPTHFAFWDGELLLGPTPDAVYSVSHKWYAITVDLAAGGDIPAMPARWHPAIADQAAVMALGRDRDNPQAAMWQARVERARAQMLRELRQVKGPIPVRVVSGW